MTRLIVVLTSVTVLLALGCGWGGASSPPPAPVVPPAPVPVPPGVPARARAISHRSASWPPHGQTTWQPYFLRQGFDRPGRQRRRSLRPGQRNFLSHECLHQLEPVLVDTATLLPDGRVLVTGVLRNVAWGQPNFMTSALACSALRARGGLGTA